MPPPPGAAARLGLGYRPLTDADLPFAAALYASTRMAELAATGWSEAQKHAFLAEQHRLQHHHYQANYRDTEWLVVERGGEAVGRLYLATWPDEMRVVDIIIAEPHRGTGYGTAILSDVQDVARAAGKPVTIHVEGTNPARRLYERLGFTVAEAKGVYDLLRWHP